MRRARDRNEEQRIDEALTRVWDDIAPLPEQMLRAMARSAAAEARALAAATHRDRRRLPALRWVRIAAIALAVGAGLGFGFATWLTPSGSATSSFLGFGFLPAKGWTVVQSGTVGATGAATALAANVPLKPSDGLGTVPQETLASLPPHGVVIFARFTTRGDPGEDVRFTVRALPLSLADARLTARAQYRLRAGVEGYNVDARIYFGAASPSPESLAAAQQQLNRLVVAAERVTIFARPTTVSRNARLVTFFGSVDNGKADEVVDIQAKECGQAFFRGVAGATTRQGGGWSTTSSAQITTTFRAVWQGAASAPITVRARAFVNLVPRGSTGKFWVAVGGKQGFWRKRILIQRFDRRLATWTTVKSVLLTDQGGYPGSGEVVTSATFRLSLPKGTLIRAFLPLAQARPCYLAGVSQMQRT